MKTFKQKIIVMLFTATILSMALLYSHTWLKEKDTQPKKKQATVCSRSTKLLPIKVVGDYKMFE